MGHALWSFSLLCAASALFYGSDRRGTTARFASLQSPQKARLARWVGGAAVLGAVLIEARSRTSLPALVLSVSVAFMVALTLVTLALAFFVPREQAGAVPVRSARLGVRSGKPASTARAVSAPRRGRARAATVAHALASTVGTLPAAFFGSAALMRWLPGAPPARFATAILLAIPLWVIALCSGFVARSTQRACFWCAAAGGGLAALVHWVG
jgi:hypothetical protein